MDVKEILHRVDHTLLSPTATGAEIRALCDDAIRYECASVCIPASYVKHVKEYVGDQIPICTVIGFPSGYSTTYAKVCETGDALANGADEIDMVINLGWVKDGEWDEVLAEIRQVRAAAGRKILKVIVETCLLTEEEKVSLCKIVSASGADFIKTSTGFSTGGATFEDIKLFRDNVASGVKIKAAGGIKGLEDAEKFIALGADRLGTSRIVKAVKEMEKNG